MTEFKPVKRKELIVWLYSLKQLRTIRKYGFVHYVSERLKYVVLYIDAHRETEVTQQLQRYHFVRKVEPSYRSDIDMTFKDAIPNRKDPDLKAAQEEPVHTTVANDGFLKEIASSLTNTK